MCVDINTVPVLVWHGTVVW